jgi:uncharacterized protein (TIGR00297 family)
MPHPLEPLQILTGGAFALLIAVASFRSGLLTRGGSAAQFVLGWILLGLGGWQWTVPILVFFVSSSLASRLSPRRRRAAEIEFAKTGKRDAFQVLANGGVVGLLCLIWTTRPDESLYVASLGALGAATADTWGTELGILSRTRPILITTLHPVRPGTSGAVSIPGTLAGIIGAALVVTSGIAWIHSGQTAILLASTLAGALGSLCDSLLGATVQMRFRCTICGRITEREIHCGAATEPALGLHWVSNDVVNFACTLIGSVMVGPLVHLLA